MERLLDVGSLVVDIEELLTRSLTTTQARVASLQIIVSRLGEDNAWKLWNSSIWARGHIGLRPIFASTYPRQRVLLAIAAAKVAVGSREAGIHCPLPHLFRLDPLFDAMLQRSLLLVSIDAYIAIGVAVDKVIWSHVESLEALAKLGRPNDPEREALIDQVHRVGIQLSALKRSNSWAEEINA